jgi:hypothetical protein
MPSRKKPEWEVRVHAKQLDDIDADLMTQIVIMLGRELIEEAAEQASEEERTIEQRRRP